MLDNGYVLYILMRTDMDSMNPGKSCAQAAHAANAFVEFMHFSDSTSAETEKLCNEWREQTGLGFGTTIVLDAGTGQELNWTLIGAIEAGLYNGEVEDPTYPVQDGEVTHLLPIITCGYVFGKRDDPAIKSVLGNLPLLP